MKRKRLLILGATSETVKLVVTAEQMGIETFVVDPYDNAPAKAFATNALNCDCYNINGICRIVKDCEIDGVLPGCADTLVPIYEEVCRRMHKFCYVNKELVVAFNNKKGLKNALARHGLSVINEYSYDEVTNKRFNSFPLFIKPVDNNSSKGMSVVHTHNQFEKAYQKALSFSKTRTVLIEDYMECDDFYVGYFAQNGEVGVSFTGDRYVINQTGVGSITSGIIYPSKYSTLYFDTVHEKMLDLFKELNFQNGICAIQGFVENGKIMFYDPALRITGGQEYVLIRHFSALDELENLVNFAIWGTMLKEDVVKNCNASFGGGYGCNLTFSVKQCTIGAIEGIDYARERVEVINITQEHDIGDTIDKIGTAQQNISRMHVVADSAENLCKVISDLQQHIKVYGINGNNVLLNGLNPNIWLGGLSNG